MRTALLAAHQTTADGGLRAELVLAQRPVLAWQAGLARELGCRRIIVLCERASAAVVALEQDCRAQGIVFHRLGRFADLAALLHGEDELLIIGDGLMPEREATRALLAPGGPDKPLRRTVLCLPDGDPSAVRFPEDFERIDAARCWAGVLVMRAAPAQALGEFPPDSNAVSLLLRMALQVGTACHIVAPSERGERAGLLASDPHVLAAEEQAMIERHRDAPVWSAPGAALAGWAMGAIGTRGWRSGEPAAMLAGVILMLTALVLAAQAFPLAAVMAAVGASFAFDLAGQFARLQFALLGDAPAGWLAVMRDPGRDILLSLALMLALAPPTGLAPVAALGPLALGLTRIAADAAGTVGAAFWRDRSLHLILLALGAGFGVLGGASALLALGALASVLFIRRQQAAPQ
jgi:hypothetical protein